MLSNKDERKNEIVAFNDFAPTESFFVGSMKKSYEQTSREKRQKKNKNANTKKKYTTGKEKKMLKKKKLRE